jgi:hypothetical protein
MKNMPTVEVLAKEFSKVIREWLTPIQLQKVNFINAQNPQDSDICASHNFVDANMAMLEALENLNFKPKNLFTDEVMDLICSAWKLAKENKFKI